MIKKILNTIRTNKKKYSFLLPAVLSGILVFEMLPQTQTVLREVPEKMQLIEEVAAEEPDQEPDTAAKKAKTKSGKKEKEEIQTAVGHYEDGVFEGSSRGYGGMITVQVTVKDGQITEVKILSAPGETDPYFTLAQTVLDQVKTQQTWEVDTISGATYSSRGILGAVQNALTGEAVENAAAPVVKPQGTTQQDAFQEPDGYKDGTYSGTAQGFGGPISVSVTIKKGKIASITITNASGETSSYLNSASAVINRIITKGSPNVDTVSGATYSSTGIINAVKRALSKASANGSTDKDTKETKTKTTKKKPAKKTKQKKEKFTEPSKYVDGTYYGTAEGFGGDIKVKVVISGGKIKSVSVVSAKDETDSYLKKAKAVIDDILKKGTPNVDTVSGATYSSTGIINAVKRALKKAAATADAAEEVNDDSKTSDQPAPAPSSDVYPAEPLKDGVYTGTGEGYGGDISVQLTVSGGRISEITIVSAENETSAYLNRAKNLITSVISKQSPEVDTISGATRSSNGILEAVRNALSEAAVNQKDTTHDTESETGTGQTETIVKYQNGTYESPFDWVDDGDIFCYQIKVIVTIEDNQLAKIDVDFGDDVSDEPEENDHYIERALYGYGSRDGILKKILDAGSADVDTVSGATYTSDTVRRLASDVLGKIKLEESITTQSAASVSKKDAKTVSENIKELRKADDEKNRNSDDRNPKKGNPALDSESEQKQEEVSQETKEEAVRETEEKPAGEGSEIHEEPTAEEKTETMNKEPDASDKNDEKSAADMDKEPSKKTEKDTVKETVKDTVKDTSKETVKDTSKDTAGETSEDSAREDKKSEALKKVEEAVIKAEDETAAAKKDKDEAGDKK